MAGICSAHQGYMKHCPACNTEMEDLFPDLEEKTREAAEAGTHTCICGFTYYLTINLCPKCSTLTKDSKKSHKQSRKIDDDWEVSKESF